MSRQAQTLLATLGNWKIAGLDADDRLRHTGTSVCPGTAAAYSRDGIDIPAAPRKRRFTYMK
jgi:hypothetical protein